MNKKTTPRKKEPQERKVFHLCNKVTNENHYFGSLKALFENTPAEIIGTPSYTYFVKIISDKNSLETDKMKIIKSILITKKKENTKERDKLTISKE